jgi:hypothetical protein
MFVYGVEFFAFRPGLAILALGLLLTVPLAGGPLTVGRVHFSLHWMLLGLTLTVVGLQSFYVGCLAKVLHDYTGAARRRWLQVFPYTRTVFLSGAAFLVGLALAAALLADYLRSDLALSSTDRIPYLGVLGIVLMIGSFLTFCFILLLHALALRSEEAYGPHR